MISREFMQIELMNHLRSLGGPGSGNFDHAGIPGQQGGSAPGGSGGTKDGKSPKEEYEEKMSSGMKKVDDILASSQSKSKVLKELKDKVQVYIDGTIEYTDIRNEARDILHRRYLPSIGSNK
jgi:hypothetical protein